MLINILSKKLVTLITVLSITTITLILQLLSGSYLAFIVRSIPNNSCDYYGGCFNLVGEKNFGLMLLLIYIILLIKTFSLGKLILKESIFGIIEVIISVILIYEFQQLDWYNNCQDFCGFFIVFIFPIILFFTLFFSKLYYYFKIKK